MRRQSLFFNVLLTSYDVYYVNRKMCLKTRYTLMHPHALRNRRRYLPTAAAARFQARGLAAQFR